MISILASRPNPSAFLPKIWIFGRNENLEKIGSHVQLAERHFQTFRIHDDLAADVRRVEVEVEQF